MSDNDFTRMPFPKETRENLKKVFTDDFMRGNTNHGDFNSFMFSSMVFVNWNDDLLLYSQSQLDAFVSETTKFSTWKEMIEKGTELFEKERRMS